MEIFLERFLSFFLFVYKRFSAIRLLSVYLNALLTETESSIVSKKKTIRDSHVRIAVV